MSKYFIKQIVVDMLRYEDEILMNAFMLNPDFKKYASGTDDMCHKSNPNWLIMSDINVPCGHAFNELLIEGKIVLESVRIDVAKAGGDDYKLPQFDPLKKHKSMHWMPLKAVKGPNFPFG